MDDCIFIEKYHNVDRTDAQNDHQPQKTVTVRCERDEWKRNINAVVNISKINKNKNVLFNSTLKGTSPPIVL